MHEIDCESLIALDNPDALVLAILCDFKNKDEKEVCYYIVKRLSELTSGDGQAFGKYTQMLETLSKNRNLKHILKEVEAMLSAVTIEDLPSYELGMERGIEKGKDLWLSQGLSQGYLESAVIFVKALGLSPDDVAKKLNVSVDDILKKIELSK